MSEPSVDDRLRVALRSLLSAISKVERVVRAGEDGMTGWVEVMEGISVHNLIGLARGEAEEAAGELLAVESATRPPLEVQT